VTEPAPSAIELTDGAPIEIVGAVLSTVVVPPVKGKVVLKAYSKPVELARFRPIVPSPEPVLTGTDQAILLLVVGVPTLAPLTPEVVNEKLLAVTPVIAALNVTVNVSEPALV